MGLGCVLIWVTDVSEIQPIVQVIKRSLIWPTTRCSHAPPAVCPCYVSNRDLPLPTYSIQKSAVTDTWVPTFLFPPGIDTIHRSTVSVVVWRKNFPPKSLNPSPLQIPPPPGSIRHQKRTPFHPSISHRHIGPTWQPHASPALRPPLPPATTFGSSAPGPSPAFATPGSAAGAAPRACRRPRRRSWRRNRRLPLPPQPGTARGACSSRTSCPHRGSSRRDVCRGRS
jgi:hypothetical protein